MTQQSCTLRLNWPPKELRPNASSPGNWRRKSEAAKSYKNDCFYLAKAEKPSLPYNTNIHLQIKFHPKTAHHTDLDNCLASIKAGIDGIALAWGINDKFFNPITIELGEPVQGGKVMVRV